MDFDGFFLKAKNFLPKVYRIFQSDATLGRRKVDRHWRLSLAFTIITLMGFFLEIALYNGLTVLTFRNVEKHFNL